nr:MAG TPA: Protein of unknown function (DUF2569) [Caudoviricetes sp.]
MPYFWTSQRVRHSFNLNSFTLYCTDKSTV